MQFPPSLRYGLLVILASVLLILAVIALPFRNPGRDAVTALSVALLVDRGADCPLGQTLRAAWHAARGEKGVNVASQFVERSDEGYELHRTPAGNFWIPPGNLGSLAYLLVERQRQPMRDQVKSGEVVIDCGANIGFFTREALNAGASKVMAIEPLPQNAECLRRTFAREITEGRVIVEQRAAWEKEASLELTALPENSEMATVVLERELIQGGMKYIKIRVPATPIDTMVRQRGLVRVDLIKMDIEGAERHALEGASWTVRSYKPRLSLAAYHLGDDVHVLTSIAARLRPDYVRRAGGCIINRGRCVPESLYFQ